MFATKTVTIKAPAGPARAVAVRAQADRRAVLGSLVAGVSVLVAGKASAEGVTNVDLFDDRAVKAKGFDIIYEARDLDLPQSTRDGIDQYRGDLTATKQRFQEAKRRIDTVLDDYIQKGYWTEAKEELRRQVGNFRQDLTTLSGAKGSKAERKQAIQQAKDLVVSCEELDFAFRKKDQAAATAKYAVVTSKLAAFSSFVQA